MVAIELLAVSPAVFIGASLLLGLMVGSFLNVVIYRLPLMLERHWHEECSESLLANPSPPVEAAAPTDGTAPADESPEVAAGPSAIPERFNLIVPRSACPACRAPITALQNVPILSWLVLRGRCASCGATISVRYPLVEALTAVLSALVAWKFGFGWPAVAALLLTWFLIALTFIDIDHQLLPDSLTLPLLWLGLFLSLWSAHAAGATVPVDPRSSLIGAMAGYVSLWSVYHLFRLLTGKDGMGYGDFKLFAALGAWLGWQMLLPVILLAAASGAILGLLLIVLRRHERGTPIPFGPYLAVAGWLVMMWPHQLVAPWWALAR
jgi:leader peptidase (prepilin peptidase)/N-methyltransferase